MLHPAGDDNTLGYLSENSCEECIISKNRKSTFATYQNSVMMSLRGEMKAKKLPPQGEATQNFLHP